MKDKLADKDIVEGLASFFDLLAKFDFEDKQSVIDKGSIVVSATTESLPETEVVEG